MKKIRDPRNSIAAGKIKELLLRIGLEGKCATKHPLTSAFEISIKSKIATRTKSSKTSCERTVKQRGVLQTALKSSAAAGEEKSGNDTARSSCAACSATRAIHGERNISSSETSCPKEVQARLGGANAMLLVAGNHSNSECDVTVALPST